MATASLYILVSLFERNWVHNVSPHTICQPGGVGLVRRLHDVLREDGVFAAAFDTVVADTLVRHSDAGVCDDVSELPRAPMKDFVLRVLIRMRGRDIVRSIAAQQSGAGGGRRKRIAAGPSRNGGCVRLQ